ncbi:MAG: TIGR03620 family F420-dependent LLM class oxidoreductase [Acidimicrobiales bacterium]
MSRDERDERDDRALPRWRQRLGRLGIWVSGPAIDDGPGELARLVERLGYTGLWIGGGNPDPAAFSRLEAVLAATDRLVVATGIANIWAWEPAAMVAQADRLVAAFPDRFVLGLGVSHAPVVAHLGRQYEQPYAAMVAYLDSLDTADGTGGERVPRLLAALGPRMLQLSAARSAGAHPYLTTPEHTTSARETLGLHPLLAPEQALVLEEDADVARRIGRSYLERYLRLPNYTTNLRRFGWTAHDIEDGGSDALVDALVLHGSPDRVVDGVRAHFEAGADHVCIQPLAAAGGVDRHALELLAPSLEGG